MTIALPISEEGSSLRIFAPCNLAPGLGIRLYGPKENHLLSNWPDEGHEVPMRSITRLVVAGIKLYTEMTLASAKCTPEVIIAVMDILGDVRHAIFNEEVQQAMKEASEAAKEEAKALNKTRAQVHTELALWKCGFDQLDQEAAAKEEANQD